MKYFFVTVLVLALFATTAQSQKVEIFSGSPMPNIDQFFAIQGDTIHGFADRSYATVLRPGYQYSVMDSLGGKEFDKTVVDSQWNSKAVRSVIVPYKRGVVLISFHKSGSIELSRVDSNGNKTSVSYLQLHDVDEINSFYCNSCNTPSGVEKFNGAAIVGDSLYFNWFSSANNFDVFRTAVYDLSNDSFVSYNFDKVKEEVGSVIMSLDGFGSTLITSTKSTVGPTQYRSQSMFYSPRSNELLASFEFGSSQTGNNAFMGNGDSIFIGNFSLPAQVAPGLCLLDSVPTTSSFANDSIHNSWNHIWTDRYYGQPLKNKPPEILKLLTKSGSPSYHIVYKSNIGDSSYIVRMHSMLRWDRGFIYKEDYNDSRITTAEHLGDTLLLGGNFKVSGQFYLLRMLNPTTGKVLKNLLPGNYGTVTSISYSDSFLYVLGDFKALINGKSYEDTLRLYRHNWELDSNWTKRIYRSELKGGPLMVNYFGNNIPSIGLDTLNLNAFTTLFVDTSLLVLRYSQDGGLNFKYDTITRFKLSAYNIIFGKLYYALDTFRLNRLIKSRLLAYDLRNYRHTTIDLQFDGHVRQIGMSGTYVVVAGDFTESHQGKKIPLAYVDLERKTIREVETTGDEYILPQALHDANHQTGLHYLLDKGDAKLLLYEYDLNKRSITKHDFSSDTTLPTSYSHKSFDVLGDSLYILLAHHSPTTIDVFNISQKQRVGTFIKGHRSPNQIHVDRHLTLLAPVETELWINPLDTNILFYGIASVKYRDSEVVPQLAKPNLSNVSLAKQYGDTMLFYADTIGNSGFYKYNLKTMKLERIIFSHSAYPITEMQLLGNVLYYADSKMNKLFEVDVRDTTKVVSHSLKYNPQAFFVNKGHCFTVQSTAVKCLNLKDDSEIWSLDFEPDYYLYSKDQMFLYKGTAVLILNDRNEQNHLLYVVDTATGDLIFSRALPPNLSENSYPLMFKKFNDYLFFRTFSPIDGEKIIAYHLPTGIVDTKFFPHPIIGSRLRLYVDSNKLSVLFSTRLKYDKTYLYADGIKLAQFPLENLFQRSVFSHTPKSISNREFKLTITGRNLNGIKEIVLFSDSDTISVARNDIRERANSQLICNVNGSKLDLGYYNLKLVYSADTILLWEAILIDSLKTQGLRLDWDLPTTVRANRPYTSQIVLSNPSNSDAYFVPLFVGRSSKVSVKAELEMYYGSKPGEHVVRFPSMSLPLSKNQRWNPLLIPTVPAGGSVILQLDHNAKGDDEEFVLWSGQPLCNSLEPSAVYDGLLQLAPTLRCGNNVDSLKMDSCLLSYSKRLVKHHFEIERASPIQGSSKSFPEDFVESESRPILMDQLSEFVLLYRCAGSTDSYSSTLAYFEMVIKNLFDSVYANQCFHDSLNHSFSQFEDVFEGKVQVVRSMDPNYKSGPQGELGTSYSSEIPTRILFTIHFENDSSATAPAQRVILYDTLNTKYFDLNSVEFTSVRIGDYKKYFDPGTNRLEDYLNLRDEADVVVHLSSTIDTSTGALQILFNSLQPDSMTAKDLNPLAGFLPANRLSNEGQGSISFWVDRLDTLPSETISNTASIVFDENKAIITNTWMLNLDSIAPTSRILPILDSGNQYLDIRWVGSDSGSGISNFDIYVSKDSGAYFKIQNRTSATSHIRYFDCDCDYRLYSIARDTAGNVEKEKWKPDQEFRLNCNQLPKLNVESLLKGPTGYNRKNYILNSKNELHYSNSITIGVSKNDSVFLKNLALPVMLPQIELDRITIDSISLGDTTIRINRRLWSHRNELGVFKLDTTSIKIDYTYNENRFILNFTSVNQLNHEPLLKRTQGFALVHGLTNVGFDVHFTIRMKSMPEHLDSAVVRSYVAVEYRHHSDTSVAVNIFDLLPPETVLHKPIPDDVEPLKFKWTSTDDGSGIRQTNITLLLEGNEIRSNVVNYEQDSFQYTLPESGNYKLIVSSIDSLFQEELVGVDNSYTFSYVLSAEQLVWPKGVKIYPVPSNGKVHLEFATESNWEVGIHSIHGEVIYSKSVSAQDHSIALALKPGVYTVTCTTLEKQYTKKIIVTK